MSAGRSLIWTEVDYDKAGKQIGFLNLPHSVTRSAYGVIRIPIAVIRHGSGPTILLMAGNHGDEYEGQIALTRHFRQSGLVICRRAIGRCEPGDCLFHLATDMPAPA
jgi:hypothetical protein